MGLDMYLHRDVFIHTVDGDKVVVKGSDNKVKKKITIHRDLPGIHIREPLAYWRKANAIHKYLLGCAGKDDDGSEAWLYGHHLKQLKEICQEVLDNHDLAKEKLPTCDGFFFGSTDYDDYYFEQLRKTITMIDAIDNLNEYDAIIYTPSW